MISTFPPPKVNMSSNVKVTQLEARPQKARAKKAAWKAMEVKRVSEEKVGGGGEVGGGGAEEGRAGGVTEGNGWCEGTGCGG